MTANSAASRDLRAVVHDPVRFARGLLRRDLWPLQAEILNSVATNARTAVKACHASGKTFVAAVAALWWVTRFPDGIVVTTAPTWTQVEKQLWGEIHRSRLRSRIAFPPANKTELTLGPGNYAMGLSTNEGVRFQGFHGDHILVIMDEAPGVLPEIWEAIEGVRAGGDVRLLCLGNPTIPSGAFYDAFTMQRANWSTFTISAFDTPNLAGLTLEELLLRMTPEERAVAERPYLTTRQWVYERFFEWGGNIRADGRIEHPDHPEWQARVLGEFPTQADNALISLSWLEQARRQPVVDRGGPVRAGLDVAGPGESETVLTVVDDKSILEMRPWPSQDPRGEVVAALGKWRKRLEVLNVDAIGIGYYMAKHLEDQGFPVRKVNVDRGSGSTKFLNLKAEYYWGLRMRFQAGDVNGLVDERMISQLATILYEHNPRGQVTIEKKVDALKRGVRSPDRAESIMLAFAKREAYSMYFPERPKPVERDPEKPLMRQLEDRFPLMAEYNQQKDRKYNICADCANLDPKAGQADVGYCEVRYQMTALKALECEQWGPRG